MKSLIGCWDDMNMNVLIWQSASWGETNLQTWSQVSRRKSDLQTWSHVLHEEKLTYKHEVTFHEGNPTVPTNMKSRASWGKTSLQTWSHTDIKRYALCEEVRSFIFVCKGLDWWNPKKDAGLPWTSAHRFDRLLGEKITYRQNVKNQKAWDWGRWGTMSLNLTPFHV